MLVNITSVSKFHNTLIKPFLNFFKQQVFSNILQIAGLHYHIGTTHTMT